MKIMPMLIKHLKTNRIIMPVFWAHHPWPYIGQYHANFCAAATQNS